MTTRRKFLTTAALGAAALGWGVSRATTSDFNPKKKKPIQPFLGGLVLSTWDAGILANEGAWKKMTDGGSAVDMVEAGVMVTEADFSNLSVGLGGLPDRDGHTTLDACIMDSAGRAGSVCFLEKVVHPISVARAVMEKTPHVMLVGEGAQLFARECGFKLSDYKSEAAEKAYREWLVKSEYHPIINIENHDTIGLLALDKNGDLAGACTTSGLAFKKRGRVGDSPIIGAGLFVDNEVGAATSSGLGETVLRTLGSFLVVENMRDGMSPQKACEKAIQRVVEKNKFMTEDFQVGFIAVSKSGEVGAYSIHPGFTYSLYKDGKNQVVKSTSMLTQ